MEAFRAVAEGALLSEDKDAVLKHAALLLLEYGEENSSVRFDPTSVRTLRRELVLYGLIEVAREDRSSYSLGPSSITHTVTIWKLTDYGRRQLAAIAP